VTAGVLGLKMEEKLYAAGEESEIRRQNARKNPKSGASRSLQLGLSGKKNLVYHEVSN
jgi:hypothetical protein